MQRVIRHKLEGHQRISNESLVLHGMVVGSVTVLAGGDLQVNGMVTGDLAVGSGGTATLNGTVCGNARNHGGQLRVYGVVAGSLEQIAGTTYVHPNAIIRGRGRP